MWRRWIKVSFIVQNSLLLPQNESGPCLSSRVVGLPLSTTKDRRLGELLPHQLPNLQPAYL